MQVRPAGSVTNGACYMPCTRIEGWVQLNAQTTHSRVQIDGQMIRSSLASYVICWLSHFSPFSFRVRECNKRHLMLTLTLAVSHAFGTL
jgi:hypothetical protein